MNPLLSVTTFARIDDSSSDLAYRFMATVERMAGNIRGYSLAGECELIVCDYGSALPVAKLPWRQAVGVANFIRIPPDIAKRCNGRSPFSVPHAANAAVRRASGKFLLFCDADTYILPESFALILQACRDDRLGEDMLHTVYAWGSRLNIRPQIVDKRPDFGELTAIARDPHNYEVQRINLKTFRGGAQGLLLPNEVAQESTWFDESLIWWGWSDVHLHYRLRKRLHPRDLFSAGIKIHHLEHSANRPGGYPYAPNQQTPPREFAANDPATWGLPDAAE